MFQWSAAEVSLCAARMLQWTVSQSVSQLVTLISPCNLSPRLTDNSSPCLQHHVGRRTDPLGRSVSRFHLRVASLPVA